MRLSPPIPCPKPKPPKLASDQRKRDREREDRAESATVRRRSGGRCEVWETPSAVVAAVMIPGVVRCTRRAVHIHHMIGGWKLRGRGESAKAEHKQHVCLSCHLAITGDVGGVRLKRIGGSIPHFTDCYERVG